MLSNDSKLKLKNRVKTQAKIKAQNGKNFIFFYRQNAI
jgi:hypothetical protein